MHPSISFFFACMAMAGAAWAQQAAPEAAAANKALSADELAVVVNDDDPNSVVVAEYYRQARNIPAQNMVHVNIPNKPRKLTAAEFAALKEQIDGKLGKGIQAILLVWTAPYAVECNSITSALTMGFHPEQCQTPCSAGVDNPYFNTASRRPYTDYAMRPSMLLPTESVEQAKALIDRGVNSGFRLMEAGAYFLSTSDHLRNSRARFFPPSGRLNSKKLTVKNIKADSLEDVRDVMVYETGMVRVAKLETLRFLPGALADHLTSFGGDLLGNGQMSSLRWLEAGATASYGTVSEPCNYWQKFPQPAVLLQHYASGETALEAYWKSVAWPTQGVFIGEPLAAPYALPAR